MKIALRAVLERGDVRAVSGEGAEIARRRSITVSPKRGGRVVLTDRPGVVATAPAAVTALV
jgi:hypothetical protein